MSLNKTISLLIAGLASLVVSAAHADTVDSANTASSCSTNRSGAVVSDLASNSSINGAIASVGGIRGLLATWKSGSGTVRFYQTSSGRLVLSYDYGLVSGSARITKVCALSSSLLKMSGAVQGDPFTMYVKGVGISRRFEMGIDSGNLKEFSK